MGCEKGVFSAVALAAQFATLVVLLLVSLPQITATTLGINESYSVGDTTLIIQPINADGIRFFTPSNITKLWKVKDCKEFNYVTACLTSATNISATFTEEFIGAELRHKSTLTPTSLALGAKTTGALTLTNSNQLDATRVYVKLTLSGPGTFSDGSTVREHQGTVNEEWAIPYTIVGTAPGVVRLSGWVRYFDQNQTQLFDIDNRTATITIPFSLDVLYNNATTRIPAPLRITLTTKSTEDLKATIEVKLPPEAIVGDVDSRVSVTKQTLTRRTTLVNETKFNLTANFSLNAPPTTPIRVTYTYAEGNASQQSFSKDYPLITVEESEPALGVRIDPTSPQEPANVRIIITGNVSGALDVSGPYLEDARLSGPDTIDLQSKPAPVGNYTIALNFSWTSAYGIKKSVSGKTTLEVRPRADNWTVVDSDKTAPDAVESPPAIRIITDEETQGSNLLVWIVGGLAFGCLIGLVYVLRQLRSPVHRIETLLTRVAALHRANSQQQGKLSPEKAAELLTLEAELEELKRRL